MFQRRLFVATFLTLVVGLVGAPPRAAVQAVESQSGALSWNFPIVLTGPRPETTRVSVASDGTPGEAFSLRSAISADGRYVAFESLSGNFDQGDTAQLLDIFVHDRATRQTTRVSVASDYQASVNPAISADGRFIAFDSPSNALVPGDTNSSWDVFVYDRVTQATSRVSVASGGYQVTPPNSGYHGVPTLSGDGRYVAFSSDSGDLVPDDTNYVPQSDPSLSPPLAGRDVFVHDRLTQQTTRVSVATDGTQGNGLSQWPALSGDGRYIAFNSNSSNLVPDDTNSSEDVFVHDRLIKQTTRVSVASGGKEAIQGSREWRDIAISGDGRYVAFVSRSSDLVAGDTNNREDVFVHDRLTRGTTRVSVATDGTEGNGFSENPALSADGRFVVFDSYSSNLVADDTNGAADVFLHDLTTNVSQIVSIASDRTQGNREADFPALSADGRFIAFSSGSNNLIPNDTFTIDVFVHDLGYHP